MQTTISDRLQKLLLELGLSASQFADAIGVQRSSISHILSGRNKPSVDFLEKTLDTFPTTDVLWLITGKKAVAPKSANTPSYIHPQEPAVNEPTLFSQPTRFVEEESPEEYKKTPIKEPFIAIDDAEIERIIVFYTDKSFSEYRPKN